MRNILPVAVLALTVAMAGGAQAGSTSAPSGNAGSSVGDSLDEPMVVTADNGNVREQPNAQAKLLTTVPHGERVVMIGTANGGAWAHVMVNGVDGYMDLVQLAKAPAESTSTFTTEQSAPRYMVVAADSANVRQRLDMMAVHDGSLLQLGVRRRDPIVILLAPFGAGRRAGIGDRQPEQHEEAARAPRHPVALSAGTLSSLSSRRTISRPPLDRSPRSHSRLGVAGLRLYQT